MGGDQIGDQVLLLSQFLGNPIEPLRKRFEHLNVGLAHIVQHMVATVFRGYLQLAAHMILKQFPHEPVILIQHHVVKPEAGAHKYPPHTGQFPQLLQQGQVVALVHLHGRTGGGR